MSDYSIEQLEELTGFARRTIRYYIQQGLVEAPFGARKTPRYTGQHVEQLLLIKKFKSDGLNLSRIAELLRQSDSAITSPPTEVGQISSVTRVHISPGVSLDIERDKSQLSEDTVRALSALINNFLTAKIREDENENG